MSPIYDTIEGYTLTREEEILALQRDVEASNSRLASAVDQLKEHFEAQAQRAEIGVHQVVTKVDEVGGEIIGQIEDGVQEIEQFVDRTRMTVRETISNAQEKLSNSLEQAETVLDKIDHTVTTSVRDAAELAQRFDTTVGAIRQDVRTETTHLLDTIETTRKQWVENIENGLADVGRFCEKIGELSRHLGDPLQILRDNREAAVPLVIISSILAGIVVRRQSLSLSAPTERARQNAPRPPGSRAA